MEQEREGHTLPGLSSPAYVGSEMKLISQGGLVGDIKCHYEGALREKKEGLNGKKREMFKKFATCHLVGDDLHNYFNETMKRNDRNVTDIFMKHFPFLLKTQTVPLIMG